MAVMPITSPAPQSDPKNKDLPGVFVRALCAMGGFLLVGTVLRYSSVFSPASLAHFLGHGPKAVGGFVLIGALACAGGLPRQGVAFAGAYILGLGSGLLAAMAAQALGCVAGFFWARTLGRDWARRKMLGGRLARADRFLTARPFSATLTLRLLPIGNNLALTTLAGLSGIGARPFLIASFLGFIPQSVIFALLGSGVQVAHRWQIGIAVCLFVISGALGVWLLRRFRDQTSTEPASLPLETGR
jgi:uncharacterized membrane protein YdjX (TVP38/TMEM64 family)